MGKSLVAVAVVFVFAGLAREARAEDDGDKDKVTVVVTTDDSRVLLERRANVVEGWQTTFGIPVFNATEQWEGICAAPCTVRLSPHAAYRVSGRGIATSHEFLLPKDNEVRLDVHSRSAFWYSTGVASSVVGGILVLGGVISTYFAGNITSTEAEATVRSFGVSFLVTGGILMAAGIPLWLTQRSSVTTPDGRSL